MTSKLRKLLAGLSSLPENINNLHRISENSITLQNLLHSQAEFIRQNSDITDINNPLIDVMKFHDGMWLPLEESRFPLWMNKSEYQRASYDMAMKYVSNREIAIDAGANVGFFAKNMGKEFRNVHCFEPVWFVRACLARNATSNGIIIYPFGLSDSESEIEIHTSTIACGSGQIDVADALVDSFPIKLKARLITLDSLNLPKIDLFKIDVQGYELNCLKGAQETLKRSKAVILCELVMENVENTEIKSYLETLGYKQVDRLGKDGVFVN